MKYFLSKKIIQYSLLVFFGLIVFSFPNKTLAACQITSGLFRHAEGITFDDNWYTDAFAENNSQPYVYLDVEFNQDCAGQQVTLSIMEEDDEIIVTGDVFDDEVISASYIVQASSLVQTLVFRAGGEECELVTECNFYLAFESGQTDIDFQGSNTLSFAYECDDNCNGNQLWSYIGTVWSSTPGYVPGAYISPNDPNNQNINDSQSGTAPDDDSQSGTAPDDDSQSNAQYTPETLNCQTDGQTSCIENPLGDGSSLPQFVESLLGIIMRAGIPIIVLALVYTGFRFVAARGNPTKIADAKKLLLYTIIGSAVVLGAWTIATILTNTINLIVS